MSDKIFAAGYVVLLLLSSLILFYAWDSVVNPHINLRQYLKEVHVTLYKLDANKQISTSNAIVIKHTNGYTLMITCNHCVDGAVGLKILESPTSDLTDVVVIKSNREYDLAILICKGEIGSPILGVESPNYTDRYYNIGNGGKLELYHEGYYSAVDVAYDIYGMTCDQGYSGSGIFNDRGYMTGLIYKIKLNADHTHDTNHALAIKSFQIEEFIKEFMNE